MDTTNVVVLMCLMAILAAPAAHAVNYTNPNIFTDPMWGTTFTLYNSSPESISLSAYNQFADDNFYYTVMPLDESVNGSDTAVVEFLCSSDFAYTQNVGNVTIRLGEKANWKDGGFYVGSLMLPEVEDWASPTANGFYDKTQCEEFNETTHPPELYQLCLSFFDTRWNTFVTQFPRQWRMCKVTGFEQDLKVTFYQKTVLECPTNSTDVECEVFETPNSLIGTIVEGTSSVFTNLVTIGVDMLIPVFLVVILPISLILLIYRLWLRLTKRRL